MGKPIDLKTKELLARLCEGDEFDKFSLIEKSSMNWAWREHIKEDVLPYWAWAGCGLALFLAANLGLGVLGFVIFGLLGFFGSGIGLSLFFDWLLDRYTPDEKLSHTKRWALEEHRKAEAKSGSRKIPWGWIGLGAVCLLAFATVPGKARHEEAIRSALTREIANAQTKNAGEIAAKWIIAAINENVKKDLQFSYIDNLGFDYSQVLFFSIVRGRPVAGKKAEVISIGCFNQVHVFTD